MSGQVQKQSAKLASELGVNSGEKREGADSQSVGHFAGGQPPSDTALAAAAARRDCKKQDATPAIRRVKHSEVFRLRLTKEELDGLHALAGRTGINRSRLARKALRELITGSVDLLAREQQAVLELARQMRLIGVNLEQIARQLSNRSGADKSLAEKVVKLADKYSKGEYIWRHLVANARARIVPKQGRSWAPEVRMACTIGIPRCAIRKHLCR